MKQIITFLTCFICILNNNCNRNIPVLSYECRVLTNCIEGKVRGAFVRTGGNGKLLIGRDEIKKTDRKFKFKIGIKGLLVKYQFHYGSCSNQYGACDFDQIVNYPIKLEYLRVKKDTMEITDVENGIIKYTINNKSLIIPKNDSLSTLESKIDTVYDRNKERIILKKDYITTIKYSETLDLKTMKYIRERKHT